MVQAKKTASAVIGIALAFSLAGCDTAPLSCPFTGRTADSDAVGFTRTEFTFNEVVDGRKFTYGYEMSVTQWDKRILIENDWICNGKKPKKAELIYSDRPLSSGM